MTTGATVDQAQWAAYRQVIRDIPQLIKIKLLMMLFGRHNHQQKVQILKISLCKIEEAIKDLSTHAVYR